MLSYRVQLLGVYTLTNSFPPLQVIAIATIIEESAFVSYHQYTVMRVCSTMFTNHLYRCHSKFTPCEISTPGGSGLRIFPPPPEGRS